MRSNPRSTLLYVLIITFFATPFSISVKAAEGPYNVSKLGIVRYQDVFHPIVGKKGMVSSQNNLATEVGVEILKRGGNAVDAAVAVGFALAVTLPRAGNLGGGGFMVLHSAKNNKTVTIDYRETAPTGVTAEHFLDAQGEKDPASPTSRDAAGVPGTVAGMHKAWADYGSGKLSWKALLAPAIRLAQKGFEVNYDLAQLLQKKQDWLTQNEATRKAFYKPNGDFYRPGEVLKQKDLAWSLKQIARHGPDAFYKGAIAKKLVADMERHGGHIDTEDLAAYQPIIREPVRGSYRGYDIAAMAPPSSGGIAIIEMLNILEHFPLGEWGRSAKSLHVMAESMKLAFADRGSFVADPAYYKVPTDTLIDKRRAANLAKKISLDKTIDAEALKGSLSPEEGPSTTHYSIVDAEGNAVSNTYTLGYSYGIGKTVKGTGILLNNQIHTFSVRAGVPGAKGFIASSANKLEPNKRPVSSQSPVIVFKEGKLFLVVGSPGGSRIINAVMQVISNVIDHGMNIAEATNERRIHHQWIPDVLELEPGFNLDTARLLGNKGHRVKTTYTMGSTQSIMVKGDYLLGASDTRRPQALTKGL